MTSTESVSIVGEEVASPTGGVTSRPARRVDAITVLAWLSPLLLLGLWQLTATTGWLSTQITSSPIGILQEFKHLYTTGQLISNTAVSLERAGIGVLIGFSAGVAAGLLTGSSRLASALLDTPVRMISAVPFPAVLPIFILIFGLDEEPKIAFIAFICAQPAYVNSYAGVRGVDQKHLEVARVVQLSRWSTMWQISFPSALPGILIGLRYSLNYSVFGLIIAEQLGSTNGLGYLIANAQVYAQFREVMAVAVIYAFFGVLANVIPRGLERLLVPWAYTRRDRR